MDVRVFAPRDIVPVTSAYRVVHDPLSIGDELKTFFAGDWFPPCLQCGERVRYVLNQSV